MIKTVAKIIISTLFIIISLYFYNQEVKYSLWRDYTPILFLSNDDADQGITLLKELGFKDILHKDGIEIGVSDFFNIKEKSLNDIDSSLDRRDYRYDPYISSVDSLFSSSDPNDSVVYVKLSSSDVLPIYNIYKIFSAEAISFKIGNPLFLRIILNYLSFALILFIFSLGSKTRISISVLIAALAFFFMEAASVYHYITFSMGYFLITMIVESISFSNRYIKRNNIGLVRIILFLILFSLPTFIPSFLDFSKVIYAPVALENIEFSYDSLEEFYSSDSPSISNYFTHYAYQRSFLYGDKYLFPRYEKSVTIDEFNREDYYLSRNVKIVDEYDEKFLEDFLLYCETTTIGRFYLDYGRPFKLELRSLLSLYILEKEYLQIVILLFVILFSSLFFKKDRDKKIKY